MKISVKCFATLGEFTPDNSEAYELEEGVTVAGVIDKLGVDPNEVAIIFVNGVKGGADAVLADGDRLGLFPAVGGG